MDSTARGTGDDGTAMNAAPPPEVSPPKTSSRGSEGEDAADEFVQPLSVQQAFELLPSDCCASDADDDLELLVKVRLCDRASCIRASKMVSRSSSSFSNTNFVACTSFLHNNLAPAAGMALNPTCICMGLRSRMASSCSLRSCMYSGGGISVVGPSVGASAVRVVCLSL